MEIANKCIRFKSLFPHTSFSLRISSNGLSLAFLPAVSGIISTAHKRNITLFEHRSGVNWQLAIGKVGSNFNPIPYLRAIFQT